MLMLSISGVYAEDMDVYSSVVTESPVSADVGTSLSSCDAFYNDLSNIYEPSDSSVSYESIDSYIYHESSDVPLINEKIGIKEFEKSFDYYESPNMVLIDVDQNYMDSYCYESVDVPVVDVNSPYGETFYDNEILNAPATDMNVDYEYSDIHLSDECFKDGEINPTVDEIVEDNVIINNYNSFSKNILESIYIPVSGLKGQHDGVDFDRSDTIISDVTSDMETSERYKLIRHVTQVDNLLNFESVDAVLAINVSGVPKGDASEPVFDGISRASEYISNVGEVYFGTLSQEDSEKLLQSIGSENTLLFASIANWYSGVTLDMLQTLSNNGQICEDILDGYTVTKALLQYYPLTNELYIYTFGDNEDEHSHLIDDTNSHGLDYAYNKHENVIYKDMPNLMVLTSYGVVFIKEQISVGKLDDLNDILGAGISSETLLPDHKAIWTPLLLLNQQDLQKFVNSRTGDNENKSKIKSTCKMCDNNLGKSCGKTKCHCPDGKHRCHCCWYCLKHCWCHCHCGKHHHYHKHWNYHYAPCYYAVADAVPDVSLTKVDNSTKNLTKNSTKEKTNSSNVTTNGKRKTIESPKTNEEGPTYTLVYAIIGIAIVSILFNSSYMKRDD